MKYLTYKIFELSIILNGSPEFIEIGIRPCFTIENAVEALEDDYPHIGVLDYNFKEMDYADDLSMFKRKCYVDLSNVRLAKTKQKQLQQPNKAA